MHLFWTTLVVAIGLTTPSLDIKTTPPDARTGWQSEMLKEVNTLREKGCRCPNGTYYGPAPVLQWNATLAEAARKHALDMEHRAYFDHKTPEGRSFTDRITAEGYRWRAAAENIAYGYTDVKAVVLGWRKSKGHCKNMMNPDYREMGGGLAGEFWVQDLASGSSE